MFRLFKSILVGIPVGITVVDCIGYVARVDGISMQPCLNPVDQASSDATTTDYVFLSRFAVRNLEIQRGDVVSLISPKNPEQKLIKRVVGLQGDLITTLGYKAQFVTVPEGHAWIEGDHTGNSLDSNHFGPISLGLITAKATYILWPPHRFQKLDSALPKARLKTLSIKPLGSNMTGTASDRSS